MRKDTVHDRLQDKAEVKNHLIYIYIYIYIYCNARMLQSSHLDVENDLLAVFAM